MTTGDTTGGRPARVNAGHVTVAAIVAWLGYVLVGGLESVGRHFVILGAMRVVLFGALLAFALASGAQARRLGRAGLGLAGVSALANLVGGVGAVATDGWSYNPFAPELDDVAAPWYAYVIGLSALAFAIATILVGIAGRGSTRMTTPVVLGGALYPLVFVLQGPLGASTGGTVGHILWLAPWLVLGAALSRTTSTRPVR